MHGTKEGGGTKEWELKSLLMKVKQESEKSGLKLNIQKMKIWRNKKISKNEKLRQEEKGTTEDEVVQWHHQLKEHEFEQTLGDGEGQGSLVCCSLWGCKTLNMTEWLNNNILIPLICSGPFWFMILQVLFSYSILLFLIYLF